MQEKLRSPKEIKRLTKDLPLLPKFTHALVQEHLGVESDDTSKHTKLGYHLFSDRYVNRVEVKP